MYTHPCAPRYTHTHAREVGACVCVCVCKWKGARRINRERNTVCQSCYAQFALSFPLVIHRSIAIQHVHLHCCDENQHPTVFRNVLIGFMRCETGSTEEQCMVRNVDSSRRQSCVRGGFPTCVPQEEWQDDYINTLANIKVECLNQGG
jgi:hypothetical protein